jgi:hypothetical protein
MLDITRKLDACTGTNLEGLKTIPRVQLTAGADIPYA